MNTNKIVTTKTNSLYIHIPFCSKICPYCDFVKTLDILDFKSRYLDELIKDINNLVSMGYFFKTIYVGGGTPSVLTCDQLEKILKAVKPLLDFTYEFTFEANPESLSENKLKILSKYGVNRISIGVQSFNKKVLNYIGRDYDVNIIELINLTKKYICNINVDFIYGLPFQNFNDIKNDLNEFLKLEINHISIYSLILEKGTTFYNDQVKELDEDTNREYYDYIVSFLRENGFKRYEVSNFAKQGFQSKHNLTYRKDEEYIGIGIGASGNFNNKRYRISGSLNKYLDGIRDAEVESITKQDDKEYYLICNLRLEDGFNVNDYINRFGENILEAKKSVIDELISTGLLILEDNYLKCTDNGIALLDLVLLKLI